MFAQDLYGQPLLWPDDSVASRLGQLTITVERPTPDGQPVVVFGFDTTDYQTAFMMMIVMSPSFSPRTDLMRLPSGLQLVAVSVSDSRPDGIIQLRAYDEHNTYVVEFSNPVATQSKEYELGVNLLASLR